MRVQERRWGEVTIKKQGKERISLIKRNLLV